MATTDRRTPERADLIVRNAKVTTLQDNGSGVAEAVAVSGERIAAVGGEADVMRLSGAGTRVVDAGSRRVVPGLNDSHLHAIRGGLMYHLELRWDGVGSLARAGDDPRAGRAHAGRPVGAGDGRLVAVPVHREADADHRGTEPGGPCARSRPVRLQPGAAEPGRDCGAGLSAASEPPGGQYEFTDGGLAVRGNTAMYATIGRLPSLTEAGDRLNSTQYFLRELNRCRGPRTIRSSRTSPRTNSATWPRSSRGAWAAAARHRARRRKPRESTTGALRTLRAAGRCDFFAPFRRKYPGNDSLHGCGANSQYYVTWWLARW
jgi:hypothetical protein